MNGWVGVEEGVVECMNGWVSVEEGVVECMNGWVGVEEGVVECMNGWVSVEEGVVEYMNGWVGVEEGVVEDVNSNYDYSNVPMAGLPMIGAIMGMCLGGKGCEIVLEIIFFEFLKQNFILNKRQIFI